MASFDLAVAHHQAGRLAEAEALYRRILEIEPGHIGALHQRGILAHQIGQDSIAIELISRAIALKPDFAEAHGNLGNVLRRQGRLDEAIASYRRVLALRPDYAELHLNLGNLYQDLGRLEDAVASYHQALALKPAFAEAHGNLGAVLRDLGRLEEAAASLGAAIALKPELADAHGNLGGTMWDMGRLDEAVSCYRAALAIDAGHSASILGLGTLLWCMDQPEAGGKVILDARDVPGLTTQDYQEGGRQLQMMGLAASADRVLGRDGGGALVQMKMESDPFNADLLERVAQVLECQGKPAKAQTFRIAAKERSNNAVLITSPEACGVGWLCNAFIEMGVKVDFAAPLVFAFNQSSGERDEYLSLFPGNCPGAPKLGDLFLIKTTHGS